MSEQRSILCGLRALVITPFLPEPLDAGHRKRVDSTVRTLQALGARIVLLHFAAETPHVWGDHEGYISAVRGRVDELIAYHPRQNIWSKPKSGDVHSLDEWIDEDFLEVLERLSRRRHFDIVVVNNVWMSKCLDVFAPGVVKIIEAHDVFSSRLQAFRAISANADFFTCSARDEAFGLSRADINIAITEAERAEILALAPAVSCVHLPQDEGFSFFPSRGGYKSDDKVTFGFMGSDHPFNIFGLKALIKEFRREARWAPIELLVAGNVTRHLSEEERRYVRSLGYVRSIEEFYAAVDIVVSPLDYGSGLKIKVTEAIAMGIPILATRHSAQGTDLMGELVVPDVPALAARMADIGRQRPSFSRLEALVKLSQKSIKLKYESRCRDLANAIGSRVVDIVFDFRALWSEFLGPKAWIVLGFMREISFRGPCWIKIPGRMELPPWLLRMPPGVRFLVDDDRDVRRLGRVSESFAHLCDSGRPVVCVTDHINVDRRPRVEYVFDLRLAENFDLGSIRPGDLLLCESDSVVQRLQLPEWIQTAELPWWSDSIRWDPVLPGKVRDISAVDPSSEAFRLLHSGGGTMGAEGGALEGVADKLLGAMSSGNMELDWGDDDPVRLRILVEFLEALGKLPASMAGEAKLMGVDRANARQRWDRLYSVLRLAARGA
jgi:glycosyltransferase involved in cell wall biosynthesis